MSISVFSRVKGKTHRVLDASGVSGDMFETVVIATDGGESTERATEAALDITKRFDADLHALTVIDDGNENENESEDDGNNADIESRTTAQSVLDDLAERTDREVHTVVKEGDPAAVICSYAEQVDADVVATGTRGRDGPYKFHLGSVAEAVVHECSVPVLTVRQLESTAEQSSNAANGSSANTESSNIKSSNIESPINDG
jgi:nucleotide-binding universal stress UspA family protein